MLSILQFYWNSHLSTFLSELPFKLHALRRIEKINIFPYFEKKYSGTHVNLKMNVAMCFKSSELLLLHYLTKKTIITGIKHQQM